MVVGVMHCGGPERGKFVSYPVGLERGISESPDTHSMSVELLIFHFSGSKLPSIGEMW